MDRVSAPNYVTISGKRKFADLDLGTNTPGTGLEKVWHNGVQESLCLAVEATGQALDVGNDLQLLEAMEIVGGGRISSVSASGALVLAQAGIVFVDAAGGNVVLTLPFANVASGFAVRYEIVRTDTSGNSVTVVPSGGDVWGFGAAGSMPVFNGSPLTVVSNGATKWHKRSAAPQGLWIVSASTSFSGRLDLSLYEGEVWGGGGGGGGSSTLGGTGGGGGGFAGGQFTKTPGASLTLTIGAAGAAGATAGGNGGNGGTTSLGSIMSATGGGGGSGDAAGGGAGGTGTGGALNLSGGAGQFPFLVGGGATVAGGLGGASYKGPSSEFTVGAGGIAGLYPGVGGGGAGTANPGGAGCAGLIIIRGLA